MTKRVNTDPLGVPIFEEPDNTTTIGVQPSFSDQYISKHLSLPAPNNKH